MATVDKNFKVKHGLIVEGNTATVNGEDIITTANTTDDIAEGSANLYFTEARAAAAVADEIDTAVTDAINALDTDDIEEGATNLYFTNQRALDATSAAYDAAGAAATAQAAAEDYADGLASNYDAAGAAATAESNANSYTDTAVSGKQDTLTAGSGIYIFGNEVGVSYDTVTNYLTTSGGNLTVNTNSIATVSYVDGLAVNYDAAGAADTAQSNAEDYTDTALASYTPTGDLDVTVGGYGYLKSADLSGYATESYVGTAIDNLVDGAPGLLDTLNEIAAAINDDANYATTVTTALSNKQGTLTEGTNIDITNDVISVTGLASTDISDFSTAALSATASAYDAAGAAASAEQNAKDYADITFVTLTDLPGQLDDYVPTSEKGQALGVATLDASGYVPASQLNIDVSGDITTAIDALTTDDIEEGATNLYFDNSRALDAVYGADIYPNLVIASELRVGSISNSVANVVSSINSPSTVTGLSWAKSAYRSAKLVVKAADNTDSQVSEILVTLDSSDNVAITEFAIVDTGTELATVSADVSGTDVRIRVTTLVGFVDVTVVGTLLA